MKPTLVILAAGMGSRYGGLKQIDTFTEQGDTIIDFSLYDALEAGFGKFVFIIRKNFELEFRQLFDPKLEGKAEVAYVFQELDKVPDGFEYKNRKKPWGTGHALLMAKEEVQENFAIINADDFYGRVAFEAMVKQLKLTDKKSLNFSMVAFKLKNTVTDYGAVSRGVCQVASNNTLVDVIERTHIEKIGEHLIFKDAHAVYNPIDPDSIVSMNFWGFTPQIFEMADYLFVDFLKQYGLEQKSEFFIPFIVSEVIKKWDARVEILTSDSKWFGVTYKEDKFKVKTAIEELKIKGNYPKQLWEQTKQTNYN